MPVLPLTIHCTGRGVHFFFVLMLFLPAVHCHAGNPGSAYGLVGLRPIPADADGTRRSHGGSWEGMPTFDAQKGNYRFVAEHIDVLFGDVPNGDFQTKKIFFEHYWGLTSERDSLDPEKNLLIRTIRKWEQKGDDVLHILICREARLAVDRGYPQAKLGPFKEDGRILSAADVKNIRQLFQHAYRKKFVRHENYNLIMLVEDPEFFATNKEAQHVIRLCEGVAYEAHQFNRHWPLEDGWSNPDRVAKGAQWALEQGLEYIFYYGPVIWEHSEHYRSFIEREWLEIYWQRGLPKQHPKMHYYLNTFPHHTGRGRPVGPENDPHSILGFAKWLIQEVKDPAQSK